MFSSTSSCCKALHELNCFELKIYDFDRVIFDFNGETIGLGTDKFS